jgi:hypothetical protein
VNQSSKILISVLVIAGIIVTISAYVFLFAALTPLEQKQDQTTISPTQNIEIQATTFNGDIMIERSTSNQIELTYDLQAPQGHLNEITTTTTNQTANENTKIIAESKIQNNGLQVNYRSSITIKLPDTSQYNLTLSTLTVTS